MQTPCSLFIARSTVSETEDILLFFFFFLKISWHCGLLFPRSAHVPDILPAYKKQIVPEKHIYCLKKGNGHIYYHCAFMILFYYSFIKYIRRANAAQEEEEGVIHRCNPPSQDPEAAQSQLPSPGTGRHRARV